MPLPPYKHNPTDHTLPIPKSHLINKSILITGGANGIGRTLVRSFVSAGAFVTFSDTDVSSGLALQNELPQKAQFIQCDVRSWEQQVRVFEAAVRNSPSKSCDVVIANAGIGRAHGDALWDLDDVDGPPVKPDLDIIDVNVYGSLYTWKLAVHYFRRQEETGERDRCFVITGSMVAWIDSPGNWQYTVSKYGLHGLMRTARRSSWEQGIRVNYVAPCYIQSAIRSAEYTRWLGEQGVEFAEVEDVAACMMRVASDRGINGRSLMIVPRSQATEGFVDLDLDDYVEDGYLKRLQETQLRVIRGRWVEGEKAQGRS